MTSSAVSSRTTLPGEPTISTWSGKTLPSGISVLAPTMQPLPITARLRITEPMPIRLPSPTVQPCSMTRWPTVTSAPMCIGMPSSVCSTEPSWILLL